MLLKLLDFFEDFFIFIFLLVALFLIFVMFWANSPIDGGERFYFILIFIVNVVGTIETEVILPLLIFIHGIL